MALGALPLLHEDNREQRGHGKINAGGVKRQYAADDRAEHAAEDPVAVIQHGDPEAHIACINALGRLDRAQQGIGLIGQREDHVPLAAAHRMKSLQKGQTVEDMPAVEQQCHHSNGNKGCLGCQKRYKQILSRACVDAQAAEEGPDRSEADIAQHNTECKTDEQIAAQYGYRGGKGRTKRLFHGNHLHTIRVKEKRSANRALWHFNVNAQIVKIR